MLSLDDQAHRVWEQLQELPTDLTRNLLLEQLHDRNEVLYFKVLSEHLADAPTSPVRAVGCCFRPCACPRANCLLSQWHTDHRAMAA
jgi:hypothetical protein